MYMVQRSCMRLSSSRSPANESPTSDSRTTSHGPPRSQVGGSCAAQRIPRLDFDQSDPMYYDRPGGLRGARHGPQRGGSYACTALRTESGSCDLARSLSSLRMWDALLDTLPRLVPLIVTP